MRRKKEKKNPDVLFTPNLCLHKNTIILTDLRQWGVGRGSTLYQRRDLQSLEKEKNSIVPRK